MGLLSRQAGAEAAKTLGVWAVLVLACAALVAGVLRTFRLPAPVAASAAPDRFSEERARATVHALAGIGPRVMGTQGVALALEELVRRAQAIPRAEVVVQDATGAVVHPFEEGGVLAYRVRNVLLRIPGERPDATLVSAHYDTATDGPGAADNAAGVAVALEVARAVGSGPPSGNGLIVNLNGGEEAGLLGAYAFLTHPWARDVRVFVNLDSAGAGGESLLFQATGERALLESFARGAPRPVGSVVAQEIFNSGLIPNGTDFAVYDQSSPWPGIDLALFEDGYAYHTALDTPARLEPGTLQHLGDNVLGFVKEVGRHQLESGGQTSDVVFFDLGGRGLVVYGRGLEAALVLLTALLTVGALVVWLRRGGDARRALWRAVLAQATTAVAVPVAAAGGAVLIAALSLRAECGALGLWCACVALLSAGAALLCQAGIARTVPPAASWLATACTLVLILVALLALGVRSAFLLQAFALAAAIGTVVLLRAPRAAWAVVAVLLPIAAFPTVELFARLVAFLVPMSGRAMAGPEISALPAVLVALPMVLTVPLLAAALRTLGGVSLAGLAALSIVAAIAIAVPVVHGPAFTARNPKRAYVRTLGDSRGEEVVLKWFEAAMTDQVRFPRPPTAQSGQHPALELHWPVDEPAARVPPGVSVLASEPLSDGRGQRVTLALKPQDGWLVDVTLPCQAITSWSLSVPPPARASCKVEAVGFDEAPFTFTFEVPSGTPLELATHEELMGASKAAGFVIQSLPEWVTFTPSIHRHGVLRP
jgi:hypothetical protein